MSTATACEHHNVLVSTALHLRTTPSRVCTTAPTTTTPNDEDDDDDDDGDDDEDDDDDDDDYYYNYYYYAHVNSYIYLSLSF